jgi:ClpP class serine protease
MKNVSPETDAGAQQIQATVDALAQVFVDTVARNRNTSTQNVLESFGQGAVFVAAEALQRGMIDSIGTFESTLQSLSEELQSMDYSKLTAAALAENRADLVAEIQTAALAGVEKIDKDALRAEGAAAERERITGLEALAMPGTEALVAQFKADGTNPEAAAIAILKAAKAGAGAKPGAAAHLQALQTTESQLAPPAAGTGEDTEPSVEAAASAAVAAARKAGIDA